MGLKLVLGTVQKTGYDKQEELFWVLSGFPALLEELLMISKKSCFDFG